MTWSLIARDPATNAFGIAVATKFFAVGALVPYIESGIGAIATQALVSPYYGLDGLILLENEIAPDEAIGMLLEHDDGRDQRQVHMIDRHGRIGAYTGAACIDWCGHIARDGISVAGNMLAGPRVLDDTAAAYHANAALPFPRRLIAAMQAGETAGGDKRGKQSAALKIHGEDEYPLLDIRVDDHADSLDELARLEAVSRERFTHFRRFMATRGSPGLIDRDKLDAEIAKAVKAGGEG
jgi:uncharacterized Ntn-hydrolase superfamily protein